MKSFELKAALRKETGKKSSKKMRAQDIVPCVLYGGKENINFSVSEGDFRGLIYTPSVFVINLDIEGEKRQALMKETQFHPVTDKLLHADFYEISADKPVVVKLPVKITGSSIGVREGGKLVLENRRIAVKGFYKDIPDEIEINVTELGIGKAIRAGEIATENFEIVSPKETRIVVVRSTRAAAAAETAAENTAQAAS
ncbi:MAG: 50S ribosomal protein L25/general stress protein Ctc [Bacteroidales bacterium]|jgi:large subunit ribosomal protein L25|nr:50S ribosomal protein L25/general stress protein Ctc [Bacteroidales bacterium]